MKKYKNYIIASIIILLVLVGICFVPISASKLIPTFEDQFATDLGVKVHMEKLILRMGPMLKVKTPIMHLMYEDGQKFAQLDNVKFYIPWASILKKRPMAKIIDAKKLTVRISSDDRYLPDLVEKLNNKDYSELPDLYLKSYKLSYNNKLNDDKYILDGQHLDVSKIINFKNFKLKTAGNFDINNKQYINYDIAIVPKIDLEKQKLNINLLDVINQIKDLDFQSDIVTDIKLYKTQDDVLQASGFINIDNMSVLDKSKKNPKSFIYLTLWGDKAGILSNIYTDNDKKIYLEGMLNNSKKPVVDLKVKTDDINLGDLYKKLKIFADFSKIKNIDYIDGILKANFSLKGDLNKIKSSGQMQISDASIKANGLEIERINSNIDFSNNIINIPDTVGYVNSSPIMLRGKIDKDIDLELLMDKVELKHLCPTQLGVNGGLISLNTKISGTLDNIVHKENLQITNLSMENNGNSLSLDALKFDTNKNNTAYVENVLINTPQTEVIKIPSLKFIIDRDNVSVPSTNIFMPNSKLTLKSEIMNFSNSDITFNTIFDGYISSTDIKALKNSIKYPLILTFNGNKHVQNVNGQILVENTNVFDEPTLINLTSKFEKETFKIEDLSLINFNGEFSKDFKSNIKGNKKLIISGIVENLKAPAFKNLRIYTPQQLNVKIEDFVAQLKSDLFINGNINTPEITGQLQILNFANQKLQMAMSNCNAEFNKNFVNLASPLIKLGDSSFSVNSTVSTDITKKISIKNTNVKAKYLNTDTLLAYKNLLEESPLPIELNDGKLFAEKLSITLYGTPTYLTAFSSDIAMNNNLLTVKNIASEMFNGKLEGTLTYDLNEEKFDTSIMARGVSASPIFNIISSRDENISGVMDFDANLKGNLSSKQSINGMIKFITRNGRMSSLGKLEHLLYAQNVVADSMLRTSLNMVAKAITLKDTGLFKYLRGDIKVENGIANIKMLQSQGPLMALYIKGQYNPMTDYGSLIVLGRLSDEVISGLGAFGDFSINKLMVMLTGEETKYNITPADLVNLPQLPAKNTKEFRAIINGKVDKPSSVLMFNWISYSQKSLRQKDVPMTNIKVPSFVDELPY